MATKAIDASSYDTRPRLIGVGTFRASARAKQLVMEALDSNRLSYGPMTQRFEAEFARLHGSRFGIMSNSGTSALQLALQAMKELHGWDDGDEVIVPALTSIAVTMISTRTSSRGQSRQKPVQSSPCMCSGSRPTWPPSSRSPRRTRSK